MITFEDGFFEHVDITAADLVFAFYPIVAANAKRSVTRIPELPEARAAYFFS